MKKLFFTVFAFALLFSVSTALADSLICDPQAGVISYNLEIDLVIVSDIPAEPDGSINYDLAGMSPGPHTFKAQAIGQGGWPSDWSPPLNATKPESPLNLRVSSE